MATCPLYNDEKVRNDFNSIVERFGGTPLSYEEFTLRGKRNARTDIDALAMNTAYLLWDKHEGDMNKIKNDIIYKLSNFLPKFVLSFNNKADAISTFYSKYAKTLKLGRVEIAEIMSYINNIYNSKSIINKLNIPEMNAVRTNEIVEYLTHQIIRYINSNSGVSSNDAFNAVLNEYLKELRNAYIGIIRKIGGDLTGNLRKIMSEQLLETGIINIEGAFNTDLANNILEEEGLIQFKDFLIKISDNNISSVQGILKDLEFNTLAEVLYSQTGKKTSLKEFKKDTAEKILSISSTVLTDYFNSKVDEALDAFKKTVEAPIDAEVNPELFKKLSTIFNHYVRPVYENFETISKLVKLSVNKYESAVGISSIDSEFSEDDYDMLEELTSLDEDGGIEEESNEKLDYDSSHFEREIKLSSKVRRLFFGLDSGAKTFFGKPKYVNPITAQSIVKSLLSDSQGGLEDMISILRTNSGRYPWLEELADRVTKAPKSIQNAFKTNLSMTYMNYYTVMYNYYTVMYEDENSVMFRINDTSTIANITKLWFSKFSVSDFVSDGVNVNVDKLLNEYKSTLDTVVKLVREKKIEEASNLVVEFIGRLGFDLSEESIVQIKNNNLKLGNKTLNIVDVLRSKYSPVKLIIDKVNELVNKNQSLTVIDFSSLFNEGAFKKFARFELKNNIELIPVSHRAGRKKIYSYIWPNYLTILTNRIKKNYNGITSKLISVPYYSNNPWLKRALDETASDEDKISIGAVSIEAVRKFSSKSSNKKKLGQIDDGEHELYTATAFIKTIVGDEGKVPYNFILTSDKSSYYTVLADLFDISLNEDGSVSDDTIDYLYTLSAEPEIKRMQAVKKAIENGEEVPANLKTGAFIFYLNPKLNTIKELFDEDGYIVDEITPELKGKITGLLRESVESEVETRLKNYTKWGILKFFDKKTLKNLSETYKLKKDAVEKAIASIVTIQSRLGYSSIYTSLVPDPASIYKAKHSKNVIKLFKTNNKDLEGLTDLQVLRLLPEEELAKVLNIFKEDFNKRAAMFIASGRVNSGPNDTVNYLVAEDKATDSLMLEQLKEIIGKDAEAYSKNGLLSEGTNGQEFVTFKEYTKILFEDGNISDELYEAINVFLDNNNEEDYYDSLVEFLTDKGLIDEFNKLEFSAMKPVYNWFQMDDLIGYNPVYIKTSAYPLMPNLKSTELNKIRKVMEKNNIDRLAFPSGVKIGAPNKVLKLWDDNGVVRGDITPEEVTQSVKKLDRIGLRIQQDVPSHGLKNIVNRASQADKNLFTDLLGVNNFVYKGESYTGKQLALKYNELYKRLYEIKRKQLLEEIDAKVDEKNGTIISINKDKFLNILREEAIIKNTGTSYSSVEIEALGLEYALDVLALLPSSKKFEALINALIKNRVLKIKFPGNSYVLSTEEGYQNKLTDELESVQSNTFDKELFQKLQNILKILYPEIEVEFTNDPKWEVGENIFNQEEYNNQVNFRLKATEKVLANLSKIKQWESNKSIDKNTLWRKIGELGIPKQQLELLKESKGNTIEEKLISFVANYSYTIEINTAKEKSGTTTRINFEENPFLDEEDYQTDGGGNTQYYSNLTVPGGTNYTENEISTPLITPSIKGHAQFATDNGIGWFRGDDKVDNAEIFIQPNEDKKKLLIKTWGDSPKYKEILSHDIDVYPDQTQGDYDAIGGVLHDKTADRLYYLHPDDMEPLLNTSPNKESILKKQRGGTPTKTRRILEVQSDLFQKGRDRSDLTGTYSEYVEGVGEMVGLEERESDPKANQFLQLLNKDNNWVTFFVKSIIQDSAKKGYDKVLFPTGNTASKIEGHQTLEEFKKQKENRIKELENKKQEEQNEFGLEGWRYKSDDGFYKEHNRYGRENLTKEVFNNALNQKQEKINNEIKQLKQELERIETEGFGALRPIYNFYENTITNILKKQGYNPVVITDEYGNTWNEITINQTRDLSEILLQRNEANQIIGQANIKVLTILIDAVNQKQDTLPYEYAHFYIAWYRDTPIVQEAIKKWGSEEALVQAIGEQAVRQEGEAWNWWTRFVKWILNQFNKLSDLTKEELRNILTDAFLTRQDLNNIGVKTQGFKFEKQNVFTVNPIKKVDEKAKAKASISNKFIGFAENIPGSSTAEYAKQIINQTSTNQANQSVQTNQPISTKDNPIHVYTDGSDIKGTGKIGTGTYIEYNGKEVRKSNIHDVDSFKSKYNIKTGVSNPTMEIAALVEALEEFKDRGEHLVIHSDYQGVQKWISGEWKVKQPYIEDFVNQAKDLIAQIEKNGGSVQLKWVRGHSGVKGNEMVDAVAKDRNVYNNISELFQTSQVESTINEVKNNIVNSGNYSSSDVVFVSIPGKRGDLNTRREQQNKTIDEALKAIEAGAVLITDNKEYVEKSDYNEGEKRLAEVLRSKGYQYSETTVDGHVLGVWTKSSSEFTGKTPFSDKSLSKESQAFESTSLGIKEDIIYTTNFKGTLNPGEFVDENGNTLSGETLKKALESGKAIVKKPAQVIVPWKFAINGKKINIRDYIVNGRVDLSKIDKEALEIFGMRIPNAGLNSHAYIEIVGFLPEGYGDLVIAPRDFLAQMGSDFDVDKLFTYASKVYIKDGVIKALDLDTLDEYKEELSKAISSIKHKKNNNVQSDIAQYYNSVKELERELDRAEEEAIKGEIKKIHNIILKTPDPVVMYKNLTPTSFWKFDELAKEAKEEFNSILPELTSDAYQRTQRKIANSGKELVGVFALYNSFVSMFQISNISLNLERFVLENNTLRLILNINGKRSFGDVYSPLTMECEDLYTERLAHHLNIDFKEARKKAKSDMSYLFKLLSPDEITFRSEVLNGLLQSAVDNQKEQILGPLGININNASLAATMAMLGYGEEVAYLFRVPAIKKVYDLVEYYQSGLVGEYYSNSEILLISIEEVLKEITNGEESNILELIGKYGTVYKKAYNIEGLTTAEMKKAIESDIESDIDNDIDSDIDNDIDSELETNLKALGTLYILSGLSSQVSTIINGLKIDSKFIAPSYSEALMQKQRLHTVLKLSKANKTIYNIFDTNTVQSSATTTGLGLFSELYRTFYAKSSEGFMAFLDSVSRYLKVETVDDFDNIWNFYTSYLYVSAIASRYEGKSISEVRETLLSKDSNNSISKHLLSLKNDDRYKNNLFIKSLEVVDISKAYEGVKIGSSLIHMEEDIIKDMLDLYYSGTPTNISDNYTSTTFIEDLVAASILQGNVLDFTSPLKVISTVVLEDMGIIQNIINTIKNPNGFYLYSSLYIQFIQYNPEYATPYKFEDLIEEKDSDGNTSYFINVVDDLDYKIALSKNIPYYVIKIKEGDKFFRIYLVEVTEESLKDGKVKLVELPIIKNKDYLMLDPANLTLDASKLHSVKKSPYGYLNSNTSKYISNTVITNNTSNLNNNDITQNTIKDYSTEEIINKLLVSNDVDPYTKHLLELFRNYSPVNNTRVTFYNNYVIRGRYTGDKILIGLSDVHGNKYSAKEIAQAFAHELVHSIYHTAVNNAPNNTKIKETLSSLDNIHSIYTTYIKTTYNNEYNKFHQLYTRYKESTNIDERDYLMDEIKKLGDSNFLQALYATTNTNEFMSVILSNPDVVRDYLNKVPAKDVESKKTLLDSIAELFRKLMDLLGFNTTRLTEQAITESLTLYKLTSNLKNPAGNRNIKNNLPNFVDRPSPTDILRQFGELNPDGTPKLLAVDKNGSSERYKIMQKRAIRINKGQSYYRAYVAKTTGESVGRPNQLFYFINLIPITNPDVNSVSAREANDRKNFCR